MTVEFGKDVFGFNQGESCFFAEGDLIASIVSMPSPSSQAFTLPQAQGRTTTIMFSMADSIWTFARGDQSVASQGQS